MQQDRDLEKRIQERVSVSRDNIVNLDIVLEDGHTISHVGVKERDVIIYGCRTKVGCVGGVATKPDYREKGLATRLMKRAIQKIDEDQGDVMLVSGDRDLYRRCGCVGAAPVHRFTLAREDADKLGVSNIQLVPYTKDDLLRIVNVQQREPVRFHRSLGEFRVLLEKRTPAPYWTKTDVFTVQYNGDVVGYAVTQEPRDDQKGRGRLRAIAEYAGSREAVAGSIKPLFDRFNVEGLLFFVPDHDVEFLHILKQKGIQGEKRNLGGHTFRIVNFPRLMDRFSYYVRERVGEDNASALEFAQDDGKYSIRFNQERLELDDKSLVTLVFGTHDGAEKGIMSGAEGMSDLLQSLFPLPFLWPGLNSY